MRRRCRYVHPTDPEAFKNALLELPCESPSHPSPAVSSLDAASEGCDGGIIDEEEADTGDSADLRSMLRSLKLSASIALEDSLPAPSKRRPPRRYRSDSSSTTQDGNVTPPWEYQGWRDVLSDSSDSRSNSPSVTSSGELYSDLSSSDTGGKAWPRSQAGDKITPAVDDYDFVVRLPRTKSEFSQPVRVSLLLTAPLHVLIRGKIQNVPCPETHPAFVGTAQDTPLTAHACRDWMRGRCHRYKCKFLHPALDSSNVSRFYHYPNFVRRSRPLLVRYPPTMRIHYALHTAQRTPYLGHHKLLRVQLPLATTPIPNKELKTCGFIATRAGHGFAVGARMAMPANIPTALRCDRLPRLPIISQRTSCGLGDSLRTVTPLEMSSPPAPLHATH